MGQRGRDIWAGVRLRKIFWSLWMILGMVCRQTATVDRMDSVINQLTITHQDVVAAAERIAGQVETTPLVATAVSGERIWLKCECLQTGGAFKLRGATNRLLQLTPEEQALGVVAFSSGNHARGVAIAAKRLGIRAVIVMPADAPKVKVDGTAAEGPEIVFFDRLKESREEIAGRIAGETGATVVPSYDDPHIVAGQGTAGLEIVEQLGRSPPRIVTPCGGGGLAAGLALAVPDANIVVAEPEGWDDMVRSLELGEIVPVGPNPPPTLCDAIQTLRVADLTFGILKQRQARGVAVSDAEVEAAIRFAWEQHGLVVEPGGAAALAAVLSRKVEPVEDTVVVVSGGNIDPALHTRIVGV